MTDTQREAIAVWLRNSGMLIAHSSNSHIEGEDPCDWLSQALLTSGLCSDKAGEREKALEERDLYYLRSILRNLEEFRDISGDAIAGFPSIGSEVLADNINYLDCMIDNHSRALAQQIPAQAAVGEPTEYQQSGTNHEAGAVGSDAPALDPMDNPLLRVRRLFALADEMRRLTEVWPVTGHDQLLRETPAEGEQS